MVLQLLATQLLTGGKKMAEKFFAEQTNGYDKAQVDDYIRRLTEAYQTAYNEYQAVCVKYNALLQENKKLETEKQFASSAGPIPNKTVKDSEIADIIAKTLVDSEMLARKIVENANAEAERIVDQAKLKCERVQETMEQAVIKMRVLLASENSEIKEVKEVREPENQPELVKILDLSSI